MLGLTHSAQDLPLHQPGAAGSDEISCLFAFAVMQKLMAIGIKHTTVGWLQACSKWPPPPRDLRLKGMRQHKALGESWQQFVYRALQTSCEEL